MVNPEYLKKGDKVAIVAPARFVEQHQYTVILSVLESYDLVVVRGKTTYLEYDRFAGSDADRASDLQSMLDNKDIKAIFCLRGGYGTIRIINDLNFDAFLENPKWLIGFSDITILHNKLHELGLASIHGQMPLNFVGRSNNFGLDKLIETLKGYSLSYRLDNKALNRTGDAEGSLVGGNVAILTSLIGTPYDLNTNGKILFIEEVGEYLYRFDRLMHHLKMSGKLTNLSGLVVGGLTDMSDTEPSFGISAQQIIYQLVKEYDYPLVFDFPAGHIKENYPLIFGQKVHLKVTSQFTQLDFLNG